MLIMNRIYPTVRSSSSSLRPLCSDLGIPYSKNASSLVLGMRPLMRIFITTGISLTVHLAYSLHFALPVVLG